GRARCQDQDQADSRTLPCPRGRARSGQSATRGRPARPWAAGLPDGRSTQRRAPATYRREDAVPPGAETLPGTGGQVMLKLQQTAENARRKSLSRTGLSHHEIVSIPHPEASNNVRKQ